ncbi:unnamed protein product [Closterium sp. NIES-53]
MLLITQLSLLPCPFCPFPRTPTPAAPCSHRIIPMGSFPRISDGHNQFELYVPSQGWRYLPYAVAAATAAAAACAGAHRNHSAIEICIRTVYHTLPFRPLPLSCPFPPSSSPCIHPGPSACIISCIPPSFPTNSPLPPYLIRPSSFPHHASFGPVNLFWSTRYDRAMLLFLHALTEFAAFANAHDRANHLPPEKSFQLPYKIEGDKIQGLTVKQSFNREERWTKALKYLLCDLKWALVWTMTNFHPPLPTPPPAILNLVSRLDPA